jgi:carboxymethylenebutenolidase
LSYRSIRAEVLKVNGYNGDEIEAYYARPDGDGPFPGVVVIHHMPGWDEWTLEVCWKLANKGFATISPHLYSRHGPGDPDDVAARARGLGGMADDQVVGDVAGSARFLKAQATSNGKVGVIGFCSGGRQAYIVACKVPEVDAAVDCWGGGVIVDDESRLSAAQPVAPIAMTADLHVPLLGIFGNDDENPTPEEVNRTEEELKRLGKTYEFYRYDGAGHAFFSTDRYRYRPEQAVDAWQKVFAFYNRHLQPAGGGRGTPPRWIGPSPKVALSGNVPLRPS